MLNERYNNLTIRFFYLQRLTAVIYIVSSRLHVVFICYGFLGSQIEPFVPSGPLLSYDKEVRNYV